MAKRKKPNLAKALRAVDDLPDALFGNIEIYLRDLPCLSKPKKEKITANLDADVIAEAKRIGKKEKVSYQQLMNDILRVVLLKD
ncbi:MAG: BrnA antitoxin family protein [Bacteriovoracaceae bacterium]